MALFFKRDFSTSLDELTKRMQVLQTKLRDKKAALQENNPQLAQTFTKAADDIDEIISNYRRSVTNSNSNTDKKQLLKEYKSLIDCFEAISLNAHENNAHKLIAELEKDNKNLPSRETLERVGNAFAVLFWLGVFTIATVATVISIASIPADPIGGLAFSAISIGLMGYSYYKMSNNFDGVFESKNSYQNHMQLNADNVDFLKDLHSAYEIPAESPSLALTC